MIDDRGEQGHGGSGWTAATAGLAGITDDDEYEYQPLRIDPQLSRGATATMLAVRAEFSGWELARSLKFTDGSRQVWLRRRRSRHMLPGLIV
ncbi:MAG: DUF5703 family protein [Nakamurella sp.]